ncbi:MAG TPA: flagellar basal-body rod protein FlgF [Firmicutes bacterium]|nr:flagellar basal-body rod protein FlgF [Bacillota bacterium]
MRRLLRGLYIGASGMLLELRRTETIANNLANAATNGYKRDELVEEAFPAIFLHRFNDQTGLAYGPPAYPAPVGQLGLGAAAVETVSDLAAGPLTETRNPLDLALTGEGWFAVQTPNGVRYTRDGAFTRDAQGLLVTEGGYPVLGEQGPLTLPAGAVEVGPDGTVAVEGQISGRLRLARFAPGTRLVKEGDNLFLAGGPEQPLDPGTAVRQGFIERSNVNTVREMIGLIASVRSYEAHQKLIQAQDELLQKTVNEVGRV